MRSDDSLVFGVVAEKRPRCSVAHPLVMITQWHPHTPDAMRAAARRRSAGGERWAPHHAPSPRTRRITVRGCGPAPRVGVPVVIAQYRRGYLFESAVQLFLITSSFKYHLCDSLDHAELFLPELAWHRLDNIGSISDFCLFLTVLAGLPGGPRVTRMAQYAVFGMVMLMQEKAPWDVRYTAGPVLAVAVCYFAKRAACDGWGPETSWVPRGVDRVLLLQGLGFKGVGLVFFVAGLDDAWDSIYFRACHGFWHIFAFGGNYLIWSALPIVRGYSPSAQTHDDLAGSDDV